MRKCDVTSWVIPATVWSHMSQSQVTHSCDTKKDIKGSGIK